MINLSERGLPNAIMVEGSPFLIKTDFRLWIKFASQIENIHNLKYNDLFYLFENDTPKVPFIDELLEFFVSENATPHAAGGGSGARLYDYVLDGEYIYASFMTQYGIDLCDVENLHWHKFKALFNGLKETKMNDIMQARGYTKSAKSFDSEQRENREAWALPVVESAEASAAEKAAEDEFNDFFKG